MELTLRPHQILLNVYIRNVLILLVMELTLRLKQQGTGGEMLRSLNPSCDGTDSQTV